jgi:hypothetical protein
MQMIDGRKRALAAGFGKTFADVVSGHVFPNARNVFHDMAVAIDNFIILRHRLTSRLFPSAASPPKIRLAGHTDIHIHK